MGVQHGTLPTFIDNALHAQEPIEGGTFITRWRRAISGKVKTRWNFAFCSDLRKQARQVENEIDLKLVSFSKLGTSFSAHSDRDLSSSDTSPLLNASNSERMFDTMAMEIERLLSRLSDINDKMADYATNVSSTAPSAALLHTLQRHRDILQDYSHEFKKTQANISACREREDLLGSVRREIDSYKNSSGLNRRTDLYLKENEHIRNADRIADETIGVAIATKENLMSQRGTLKKISTGVTNMANRFPVINSLVQRINLKKRRDSLILAGVIAVCIIFILWFAFR
ncbi:Golgi SNAP receptor complex member 1-like isoform X1 [Acanthaster planci]|uniref:Golgi SNAP receptor complex member 1 n=1 Tax=Acanthaster planci TaxID=133434 RepID=A0A8B7ZTF4_ACAPL|nr:Golgi SNAP receptor complex member 1-like isoform X1 [Acanthaster planci]